MGVPVHQPLAAVDQALVVHLDEDADHGVVEIAVLARRRIRGARHGEGLTRPVAGGAKAAELPLDVAARADLLLPDQLQEVVAGEIGAALAVLGQFAFHHHLRGDPGMVGAGLPERVMPLHPVPARQHILQRVVEGVAHVQAARDVGRRDHDAEGLGPGFGPGPGLEAARGIPEIGDAGLGLGGVEGLFHGHDAILPLRGPWGARGPFRARAF